MSEGSVRRLVESGELSASDAELIRKARSLGRIGTRPMLKTCPFCVRTIALDAMVCAYCTRDVNTEQEVTDLCLSYIRNAVSQYE